MIPATNRWRRPIAPLWPHLTHQEGQVVQRAPFRGKKSCLHRGALKITRRTPKRIARLRSYGGFSGDCGGKGFSVDMVGDGRANRIPRSQLPTFLSTPPPHSQPLNTPENASHRCHNEGRPDEPRRIDQFTAATNKEHSQMSLSPRPTEKQLGLSPGSSSSVVIIIIIIILLLITLTITINSTRSDRQARHISTTTTPPSPSRRPLPYPLFPLLDIRKPLISECLHPFPPI